MRSHSRDARGSLPIGIGLRALRTVGSAAFASSTPRKKDRLVRTSLPLLCSVLVVGAAGAAPRIYPTGVTLYDPAKAWNSYVIFGAPDDKTHLIDMNGNEVHRWDFIGFPSELLDPQVTGGKLGHVLLQTESISGNDTSVQPGRPNLFRNKTVAELDWSGKV